MNDLNLKEHLIRQMVWSKANFGPGARTEGVLDHMVKEIEEVRVSNGAADEWVDLVILSFDGLTRRLWAASNYERSADEIADVAINLLRYKQGKNERREWPDWRSADLNKAIEHVRGRHD